MSSFNFNYLVKTKSIAKKVVMFLYYNWLLLQTQGKKILEWGRGIGISYWQFSTHKLDFAFDESQIQPCGEVGGDFTEPHSFQPGGVVVLGGGGFVYST